MLKECDNFQDMKTLGDSQFLLQTEKAAATKFVLALYGITDCKSLNEARIKKAKGKKSVKPRRLPPTDDAFFLHLLRCQLQI